MGLALICAGQGGVHAEMFLRLAEEPAAVPVLEATSRLAGIELFRLSDAIAPDGTTDTRPAQVLVVGHAAAAAAALEEHDVRPAVCAGYSVGEMAAHACAGAWSAAAALELTAARAECMDRAGDAFRPLGMVSLIGLAVPEVERLAGRHGCALAIVNGHDHLVVGGSRKGIEAIAAEAPELGARTVRMLPVKTASHTNFLAAAVAPFADVLRNADWRTPDCPVLSGIDGRPIIGKNSMVDLLSRQIGEPLNWFQCLSSAVEHGATVILELGPGRALTRMVEEMFPELPARAYEDFRSARGAAEWVRRHT